MAGINRTVEIPLSKVTRQLVLCIKLRGVRIGLIRLRIGVALVRLGCWIARVGYRKDNHGR